MCSFEDTLGRYDSDLCAIDIVYVGVEEQPVSSR